MLREAVRDIADAGKLGVTASINSALHCGASVSSSQSSNASNSADDSSTKDEATE